MITTINEFKNINESIDDSLNPEFIFRLTDNKLLVDILSNSIDIFTIAEKELANRGYNSQGTYVGFNTNK